jgi:cation transport ATPase
MSNNNSNMGLSDLKKQTAAKKKNIGFENPNKELLTPSNDEFTDKLQTTENFEFKSTYSCDSNLNDHRLSIEQEENNNKSTQTVSSTIAKIKYNQSLKKPKVKIEDHDALENANYNVSYSNTLLANLKTAFMLFVVTLIMAIVYTPALLTSMGYLAYNPIHWNIIYINNAANPLLYSFLNSNFRKSLKNFFSRLM